MFRKDPLYERLVTSWFRVEGVPQELSPILTEYALKGEPWIFEDALTNAIRWRERYERDERFDFTMKGKMSKEEGLYKTTCGLIGEFVFDGILDRLFVELSAPSYHWVKPRYPREHPLGSKPYDFKITDVGTIELKTIAPIMEYRRALINLDSYLGCDFVLFFKLYYKDGLLMSKKDAEILDWNVNLLRPLTEALFMGWLTKEEVEAIDIDDFGAGDCYWTYLSYEDAHKENKTRLHPRYKFFEKLKLHIPSE